MVVVAILAVLAVLANPSFTPLIERWRVHQGTEEFQSALCFVRSEAIKRGGNIHIKAASGTGWSIFHDVNGDSTQDPCVSTNPLNECDLRVVAGSSQVTITLNQIDGILTVDRWGVVKG